MSADEGVAAGNCYDIPRLLQCFESLGENCDLGVVQRAVGVEPMGLFRFAACKSFDLAAMLQERFAALGEPHDLWLDEVGPRREYWVKSRRFSFEAHTDRYAGDDDPEVARRAQIEKLRYLKARLLADLARGHKIFVFKGDANTETILDIAAKLQAHGPNFLLWLRAADASHPTRSVTRIANGLCCGYVSHYGTYDGDPSLPVEDWVAVCAHAYRLWRNGDPPRACCENLLTQILARDPYQRNAQPAGHTRLLGDPGCDGGAAFAHTLAVSEAATIYQVNVPIPTGGSFVFSTWVRIPLEFRGRQIGTLLSDYSSLAMWTADLKSRARWQRIWVTANVPVEARRITCKILAEGAIGDVFHSSAWCLERGSRPLGYGFNL